MGAILPGSGLIAAGRPVLGTFILLVFLAVAGASAYAAFFRPEETLAGAAELLADPLVLTGIGVLIVVVGAVWVGLIIATSLALRSPNESNGQRFAGSVLVALLAFVVAAPTAWATVAAFTTGGALETIFGSKDTQSGTRPAAPPRDNPWKDIPRLNILLLGADKEEQGGVRTDSVMVASIDTTTGSTTLIQLPRNTERMPFPADSRLAQRWPNGFTDGTSGNAEYLLNAMYHNVPTIAPEALPGPTDFPGADVLKLSVGEAVGLKIQYFVMLNMQGFVALIDALGGVNLNVSNRIPVGGTSEGRPAVRWIEPGPNKLLNGQDALWFARARKTGDDYIRMGRQRCVIDAIIAKADPLNVVTRIDQIVKAGADMLETDIERQTFTKIAQLALKIKNARIRSLVFGLEVPGFYSGNPDFNLVRERVSQALGEAQTPKPPPKEPAKTPATSPTKKPTKPADPGQSKDLRDACAYNPS